jgi:hypothetical protein
MKRSPTDTWKKHGEHRCVTAYICIQKGTAETNKCDYLIWKRDEDGEIGFKGK